MAYRRPPSDVERMTSLRVDNLPYSACMEDLSPLFKKFGDVGDIYLPKDRDSGRWGLLLLLLLLLPLLPHTPKTPYTVSHCTPGLLSSPLHPNLHLHHLRSRGFGFVRFYEKRDVEVRGGHCWARQFAGERLGARQSGGLDS